MKILKRHPNSDIFAMSNVRGIHIKNPCSQAFSFYFSSGAGINHRPRAKVVFNPEKLILSQTGMLELCDGWKHIPGKGDGKVGSKEVHKMKQ